jgi:hypothetical protein
MLCPAGIFAGKFSPTTANSELFDSSDEIVTDPFDAVRVVRRVAFDPTVTLPKFRVEGDTLSSTLEVKMPSPLTCILSVASAALLPIAMEPLVYPLTLGLKIMGNSTLAPGAIVFGTEKLPNENEVPCIDLERMLSVL